MVDFLDQGSFVIGMHLDNVYADGELDREATRKDFFIVRFEGERRGKGVQPVSRLAVIANPFPLELPAPQLHNTPTGPG